MNEKDERSKRAVVLPFDSARERTRGLHNKIEREQAKKIAEQFLKEENRNEFQVERVAAPNELPGRQPAVYGVEIDNCWIAYLRPSEHAESQFSLKSSDIIIVSRTNGKVLYFGSDNDEG